MSFGVLQKWLMMAFLDQKGLECQVLPRISGKLEVSGTPDIGFSKTEIFY